MNNKKNIESPFSSLPPKTPFDVPEGYFETLQDRIEARIIEENTEIPKRQQIIRFLKPILAMAASFALIFLLVYYPLSRFLPSYMESSQMTETPEMTTEEDLLAIYMDENTFYESLTFIEQKKDSPTEEVYAYLSVDVTDFDFYNELIKN